MRGEGFLIEIIECAVVVMSEDVVVFGVVC